MVYRLDSLCYVQEERMEFFYCEGWSMSNRELREGSKNEVPFKTFKAKLRLLQ